MRRAMLAVTMAMMVISLIGVSLSADAKPNGGNSDNAKACQKGGYLSLYRSDGTGFASEGECISYAANGGILTAAAPTSVPPTSTPTDTPTSVPPTNTPTDTPTSTPTDTPTSVPPTSTPTDTPTNPPTITLRVGSFDAPLCDAEAELTNFSAVTTYSVELWNVGPEPDQLVAARQVPISPSGDNFVDFGPAGSGDFEVRTEHQGALVTSNRVTCTVPPPTIALQVGTLEGPNQYCDAEAELTYFAADTTYTVELWNVGTEPEELIESVSVTMSSGGDNLVDFGPVGSGQFQARIEGQAVQSSIVTCAVPSSMIDLRVGSFNDPICDAEAGLTFFMAGVTVMVELWNVGPEPDQLLATRQITTSLFGDAFVDFGPTGSSGEFEVRTLYQGSPIVSNRVSCTVPPPTIDLVVGQSDCHASANFDLFVEGVTYTVELWNVESEPQQLVTTRSVTMGPFGSLTVDFGPVGSGEFQVRIQGQSVMSPVISCTVPT